MVKFLFSTLACNMYYSYMYDMVRPKLFDFVTKFCTCKWDLDMSCDKHVACDICKKILSKLAWIMLHKNSQDNDMKQKICSTVIKWTSKVCIETINKLQNRGLVTRRNYIILYEINLNEPLLDWRAFCIWGGKLILEVYTIISVEKVASESNFYFFITEQNIDIWETNL